MNPPVVVVHRQEPGSLQPPVPSVWYYANCKTCGWSSEGHEDQLVVAADGSAHKRTCSGILEP